MRVVSRTKRPHNKRIQRSGQQHRCARAVARSLMRAAKRLLGVPCQI